MPHIVRWQLGKRGQGGGTAGPSPSHSNKELSAGGWKGNKDVSPPVSSAVLSLVRQDRQVSWIPQAGMAQGEGSP